MKTAIVLMIVAAGIVLLVHPAARLGIGLISPWTMLPLAALLFYSGLFRFFDRRDNA